jgi:outer membrane lipoprotein SlyB
MSKDPYVNYMQYNHYPTMGYNDIAEKMQDQGALDNANKYFKEQYPEMESMQAPPEFEKGTVAKMAVESGAKGALKGAGLGAKIGSFIPLPPGVGTGAGAAIGAAAGAVIGTAAGWLKGSKLKKEAASDAKEFKADAAKKEVAKKASEANRYRMEQVQKQSDYMKTLSSGKLR